MLLLKIRLLVELHLMSLMFINATYSFHLIIVINYKRKDLRCHNSHKNRKLMTYLIIINNFQEYNLI